MKRYVPMLLSSTLLLLSFSTFAVTTKASATTGPSVTPDPSPTPVPTVTDPADPPCSRLLGTWEGTEKIRGLHHCIYSAHGSIRPKGNHAYLLNLTLFREEGSHNYCPHTHSQSLPLQCNNNLIAIRDAQVFLDGRITLKPTQLYVTGSIANNKASIALNQTAKG